MIDANLLITHDPAHAGSTKSEIEALLKELKIKPKFLKSDIDGVFMLRVSNPKKIVSSLLNKAKKDISKFEQTFHYTPIDKWVKATVKDMQKGIKGLVKNIKPNDRWKMELNKRHYDKEGVTDLILKLTEIVDRKNVDLEKPQKIIKVEICGNKAGLALLKADELLDVPKMRK